MKLTNSSCAVSAATFVQAICNLNSRNKHNNISAKEMFLGRYQFNGNRLKFSDKSLSSLQIANHTANHLASAKSKACGHPAAKIENITVGTLVYIKHEGK